MEDFVSEVDSFVAYLKDTPPMQGFEEVLIPGEIERRERARRRDGIVVEDETWKQILDRAEKLGVDID